ncbi:hypothetical protein ACFVTC_19080 [Streptomyces sp. NPDC057950]|uniref:hypothetical protein n=1 Tax=Streptomyces sp. NPDC057950 TaxID=3346288 RepID=UPI0036F0DC7A
MSQISARREAASNSARQHWLARRLLDRTSLITTHFRPTFFAEWIGWYFIRKDDQGRLRLPVGDGRHAPIAGQDQADVIAAILENPTALDRQVCFLHGPKEMDHHGIAEAVSSTLGRPASYKPIGIDEFGEGLDRVGFPAHVTEHPQNVVDYQNGIFTGTNNWSRSSGITRP